MDASLCTHVLAWAMLATGAVTFATTMLIKAPYGRYSASKGWGVLLPARLAWFVMESPNLWISMIVALHFSSKACTSSLPNKWLLFLFLLHYANRALLYPLRMRRDAAPMPFAVMGLAFLYCCWNGTLQALSLLVVTPRPDAYLYDPRLLLGSLIFFAGFASNIVADSTLSALRVRDVQGGQKTASLKQRSQSQYKIPRGGLFELVSCANYASEILEWTGFAIASWSLPALAFAVFTFCNLAPRAHHHHLWYLEKFREDYPKHRRAVIPYLW
jgi:3-oxo-5-alpha-steroid 4-dehydrogenase 1